MIKKTYLGDGAYIDYDGHEFILTTENGIKTTNTIYLEPSSMDRLLHFLAKKPFPLDTTHQTTEFQSGHDLEGSKPQGER